MELALCPEAALGENSFSYSSFGGPNMTGLTNLINKAEQGDLTPGPRGSKYPWNLAHIPLSDSLSVWETTKST